ncbi:MAG: glycosyltransferase [Spirochaetes bacterium]|nr:glycosyltransferase [Spirochaetota bacterium]
MSNFHPLVSIVIPVYNGSNYLQCAIESALGQDYDNIEVVVVNDGSTDNTEEIIKSYGDKIRYFSKENGGVATALNMAIRNARGEYISWLSHDDYYFPNKVSRQIEELGKINDREKIIPYCNVKEINLFNNEINSKVKTFKSTTLSKLDSLKILYVCELHGCSLLIPREVFYSVDFFDSNLRTTQDYFLWFKLIFNDYLFFYIDELLLASRIHSEQDSIKNIDICHKEGRELWKYAYSLFHKDITKAYDPDKVFFKNSGFLPTSESFMQKINIKLKKIIKMFSSKNKHVLR